MIADRHPSSVPAHCTPRFANICFEKSGKPAATLDRRMIFAATVEAALYCVSIRLFVHHDADHTYTGRKESTK